MVNVDPYASVGFALELLGQSPYHRQHKLGKYFRAEIFPAIGAQQIRFYLNDDGIPMALVTWAWISPEVERDLQTTGRSLTEAEWRCGDQLLFNDWVSPYGSTRDYVRDIRDNVFPDVASASSLRRNLDGSVRRINRWHRPSSQTTAERAAS